MKTRITIAMGIGCLMLGQAGRADYVAMAALQYVGEGWYENGFSGLTAFRFYAVFTEPTDGVTAVFGIEDHDLFVQTDHGVFFNSAVADSLTAPMNLTPAIWSNQWDTYVTIGVDDAAGDATQLTPGFAGEVGDLAGNFSTYNAAWFVTPNEPQALAGADLRVMIGQFVVPEGDSLQGVVSLQLIDGTQVMDEPVWYAGTCWGDANYDWTVDVLDLLAVIGAWGNCGLCREDLNHDGSVGVDDLLLVLDDWGPCEWQWPDGDDARP
jgi:hypothetical protein